MPDFRIEHITRYSYPSQVRDSANQIILYPIRDEYQDVIRHELHINGDPVVDTYIDYYGNEVGTFTYSEPHTILTISSKLSVSTRNKPLPGNDIFPAQQWEDLRRLARMTPYIDFLKPEYFDGAKELQGIVKTERAKEDTPYQVALRFCRYIYDNFEYVKGVTTVETTMDEVWKLKAGVCQDFAHILTIMLRQVNIPARYVSGYICTPRHHNMRGEGATHAWAEAYIPDYGWLGLDPTNNCVANETHVRLAVGRNFLDCSPVRGVYKGSSDHRLEVSVTVGYEDDIPTGYVAPEEKAKHHDFRPVDDRPKNSYQQYMEMLRYQQQQQQQQ